MHEQIKTVLANVLGLPKTAVPDNASVETMEAWDSLRQIRLLMALEEKFSITFSDDEVMTLTSLAAINEVVRRHKTEDGH